MRNLVLGLGNLLLADEGVGVHVAQRLLEDRRHDDSVVLDVGNALLDAMPAIAAAERVIVVDAMKGGGPPGTVYRIPLDECANADSIASVHGFDVTSVLHLVGRNDVPEVVVIGIEPDVISWSTELSEAVAAAVPDALAAVEIELTREPPEERTNPPRTTRRDATCHR
ncbi:MAG: hydrogenase maturation protease [Holophagae bacterium]|jgi:hydrogenase maturation protease